MQYHEALKVYNYVHVFIVIWQENKITVKPNLLQQSLLEMILVRDHLETIPSLAI